MWGESSAGCYAPSNQGKEKNDRNTRQIDSAFATLNNVAVEGYCFRLPESVKPFAPQKLRKPWNKRNTKKQTLKWAETI
jgi:hypothetical protein